MSEAQEAAQPPVAPEAARAVMSHLVLPKSTLETLGLVASSRRSLFIMGPPGSGKTTIAKSLHAAQGGDYWIPYALEVDGQVIKVFDAHNHEPIGGDPGPHDRRWIRIKRPLVIVGGELTIETMDLIHSQTGRCYDASFTVK